MTLHNQILEPPFLTEEGDFCHFLKTGKVNMQKVTIPLIIEAVPDSKKSYEGNIGKNHFR